MRRGRLLAALRPWLLAAAPRRPPPRRGGRRAHGGLALRGVSQTLHLYGARGGPVAIVTSGDGGWVHLGPDVAEFLAGAGLLRRRLRRQGLPVRASPRARGAAASSRTCRATTRRSSTTRARARAGRPLLVGVSEGAGLSRPRRDRARGPVADRGRRRPRPAGQERARLALARLDHLRHQEDAERADLQRRARWRRGSGAAAARGPPLDPRRVRAVAGGPGDPGAGPRAQAALGHRGGGPPLQRQPHRAPAPPEGGDRVDRLRGARRPLKPRRGRLDRVRPMSAPAQAPGFRNYGAGARAAVHEFYRLNHTHQTLDFVRAKKREYLALRPQAHDGVGGAGVPEHAGRRQRPRHRAHPDRARAADGRGDPRRRPPALVRRHRPRPRPRQDPLPLRRAAVGGRRRHLPGGLRLLSRDRRTPSSSPTTPTRSVAAVLRRGSASTRRAAASTTCTSPGATTSTSTTWSRTTCRPRRST